MALTCPQCAAAMREVKAEAVTGYLILLDQCPQCGGIWCDRWETYPVTAAAAERVDSVDQDMLRQATDPADEHLECPRCRAHMFRFRDAMIPSDARIERCPNCDGMWFNRGELRRFKEQRGIPSSPAPTVDLGAISEPQLDHLAHRAVGNRQSWPTLRSLDDFDAPEATPDTSEIRAELKSSAMWMIGRAVLRLLLHV